MFYNPQNVEKKPKFEILPKGTYRVLVSDAQGKRSSKGGRYLAITFDVIEGQYQRRKLFQNFNIQCGNPDAEERAWSDWKYLLEALELDKPFESEEQALAAVRDKTLRVKVGHTKDKRDGHEGEMQEKVQDFLSDGHGNSDPDPQSEFDADSIPF